MYNKNIFHNDRPRKFEWDKYLYVSKGQIL